MTKSIINQNTNVVTTKVKECSFFRCRGGRRRRRRNRGGERRVGSVVIY
jgi:hypothetical protein